MPQNSRPEPRIGPSCTARRHESDGDNEDVRKLSGKRKYQRDNRNPNYYFRKGSNMATMMTWAITGMQLHCFVTAKD